MASSLRPRAAVLFALAALSGCSDETAGPAPGPSLTPAYAVKRGVDPEDPLIGAAWFTAPLEDQAPSVASPLVVQYLLPERPFKPAVETVWYGAGGAILAEWSAQEPSRAGGGLAGIAAWEGASWSALVAGWGEFRMARDLGQDPQALLLDPFSPLWPAALGWSWREAGRPDTLAIALLWLPDLERPPMPRQASLIYEGESTEGGIALEGFRLEFAEGPLFCKLMADPFPAPYRAWWEGGPVFLQFFGEEPPGNLEELAFAPDFPAPESYAVEPIAFASAAGILAGEILRPAAAGPFPAVLLAPEAGPRDRDGAALFGFLAHDLAAGGCLVLRFDMPGTGLSAGLLDELDLDGRREALAAAWQALRADADAQPDHCFIVGHGEGGALALDLSAGDATVGGVAALAAPLYRPEDLPWIPEAAQAPGGFVSLLGAERFVGKYQDLLAFDGREILPLVLAPVLLVAGGADASVPAADLAEQAALLAQAASVGILVLEALNHELAQGRPDAAPAPALADSILAWIAARTRRAP